MRLGAGHRGHIVEDRVSVQHPWGPEQGLVVSRCPEGRGKEKIGTSDLEKL